MLDIDEDNKTRRKRVKEKKARLRRKMLSKMPKGGVCAEVGVWRGDFTRMLLNQLKPQKLTLIDPWKNFDKRADAFDGRTEDQKFEDIYDSVCDTYAREIRQGVVEVQRSLSSEAFAMMEDETLDFVYLDGDHSYEGVKADLNDVFRIMKPGGMIMMDDYHRRGWWGDGVIAATHEFLGARGGEMRITAISGAQLVMSKF